MHRAVWPMLVFATAALGATSPSGVGSPMGGNGHNVTFDGRLFVVRRGAGWEAAVLRPQRVTVSNGVPDVSQAFSPFVLIQPEVNNENALALCEETPQPRRCNSDGTPNANGAYACYELVVIESDALAQPPANVLRQRRLRVVISSPGTANAEVDSFTWTQPNLTPLSPALRGIEPTVTRDGKLMVWQGVPANTGQGDTLVYSVSSTPCGASGWSAPKSITAMSSDPLVVGKYKLAERPLRGADGTVFASNQLFYGAYPWLFPDGEAVSFTAVGMPCRSGPPNEDPPGCGPRRNAFSVIGYPTNWQLAHVDGAVNPDTDQTVRLFFSSPGPKAASPLPVTRGVDVWPFFGSNTSNYVELVFDDGLDGRYAGLWHMNELVDNVGRFDLTRTPDSSGYSNTGTLVGAASFPSKNNGRLGKAIAFDGVSGRVEVRHATSLNPVNAITIEMAVKPHSDPDCDANNNYRLLLGKGNIGNGSYTLVLEENRDLQARVRVATGAQYNIVARTQIPIGQWSHVAAQYDAASGTMAFFVDGVETNRVTHPPAPLAGTTHPLTIGAPGNRAACPNGDGAFHGEIDEVAISRGWRYGTPPPSPDAGAPPVDGGTDAGTVPPVDAGSKRDGGASSQPDGGTGTSPGWDAGWTADGGSAQPPGGAKVAAEGPGGCGCNVAPAPLLLAALVSLLRRRR